MDVKHEKKKDKKLRERSTDDIQAFLKFLAEQAGAAEWQVKQANHALRLLYEQFLPNYRLGMIRASYGSKVSMQKTAVRSPCLAVSFFQSA